MAEHYESLVISDEELERGRAEGRLVVDTRLRDALRLLRAPDGGYLLPADAPALAFPTPTLVEDADYAVEAAVLGEADVVRLQRRLDTLERRLATIELRLPEPRVPEGVGGRRSAFSVGSASRGYAPCFTARHADDDLVQAVARVELLRAQVGGGEAVEEPGRGEDVAERLDLDRALAERLLGQAAGGAGGEVPPLAERLVLGRRDLRDAGDGDEQHAARGEDAVQRREGRADVVDELQRLRHDRAVERVVRDLRRVREVADDRRLAGCPPVAMRTSTRSTPLPKRFV